MGEVITEEMVYKQLATVIDPELNIDIVSLGLIYSVKIKPQITNYKQEEVIVVTMTLTTPGCPLAPVIDRMIKEALSSLRAKKVEIELVWDPPWTKEMMSDEARLTLELL
jgi:metal-sulfur cluster biosynthetic enzyme